jgi:pimeloyl-ACP methyl ester carboxylesterase
VIPVSIPNLHRSRWVDLGEPVHYLDFGGPAGCPIVVAVHGLGGSALNWLAIAPAAA